MPERVPTANGAPLPARLIESYRAFRSGAHAAARDRYRRLAEDGQRPRTMVVACSDSRSAPEAIFDAGPGELFVLRNVAALVPPYAPDGSLHGVSAALEYAVLALEVPAIVVMGHGRCGGIAAALEDAAPLSATDFVGTWVAGVRDLAAELDLSGEIAEPGTRRRELERRSVERSLDHLRTFPWIRRREEARILTLHGAWFDIALGELHALGRRGWQRVDPATALDERALSRGLRTERSPRSRRA
ncbi:MAG TPA: carbonic anhydrase [Candidatus Limnocylindrales bacterium]|nr:carbonic anhydrase [Candidatus Limnocylindrales bacterium]